MIRKILTCELDRSSALNIECFRKALLRIKVHHSVCIVVANIRMWSVQRSQCLSKLLSIILWGLERLGTFEKM